MNTSEEQKRDSKKLRGEKNLKKWFTCIAASVILSSMTNASCSRNPRELETKQKIPQVSDVVTLNDHLKKQSNDVQVTNDPRSWMRDNEIAYIPNGTTARILAIHDETIDAGGAQIRVLRYKIETLKGKKVEGWIWASDTGYEPKQPL